MGTGGYSSLTKQRLLISKSTPISNALIIEKLIINEKKIAEVVNKTVANIRFFEKENTLINTIEANVILIANIFAAISNRPFLYHLE